jgi:hypothetical protein
LTESIANSFWWILIFLKDIHIHSSSFSTRTRLTEYRHIQTELKSTQKVYLPEMPLNTKTPSASDNKLLLCQASFTMSTPRAQEERATHAHTHRLTTSQEKAQNKRLSPQIIPKVPPSKLSKTMSTILLTDNTEKKKKKKKKKHHQYRCKNTTVDQKALKLCVCVYMWVYVCTSLP